MVTAQYSVKSPLFVIIKVILGHEKYHSVHIRKLS